MSSSDLEQLYTSWNPAGIGACNNTGGAKYPAPLITTSPWFRIRVMVSRETYYPGQTGCTNTALMTFQAALLAKRLILSHHKTILKPLLEILDSMMVETCQAPPEIAAICLYSHFVSHLNGSRNDAFCVKSKKEKGR